MIESLPDIPVNKRITDDTKMAMILLTHYKKYREIKPVILTNSYREWANKDGQLDGIGMHTYKVYNLTIRITGTLEYVNCNELDQKMTLVKN